MRLINTKTRRLEEFESAIPPYAILSHCWGATGDKVSFQDISTSGWEIENKPGYVKIKSAMYMTNLEGLSYLWVDTCCIDKKNSVELSESINSMYQWYTRSQVCYAYLEDVFYPPGEYVPGTCSLGFPDYVFPISRWFKRGWTLQELLAPNRVEFFGFNWVYIGSKDALKSWIADYTRIPERILISPRELQFQSLARRISWASCRQTKRVEDMAYCLIGILGINLPLLYGEGDRAFRRLQIELIKQSDDETLFSWNPESRPFGMLARSPSEFTNACYHVRAQDTYLADSVPYTMTNRGLHIQLPIVSDMYGHHTWAILKCHHNLDPEMIGIPLLKTSNPTRFRRAWRDVRHFSTENVAMARIQTIYIEESTFDLRNKPIEHACRVDSETLSDFGYELTGIVPSIHSLDNSNAPDSHTVALTTDPNIDYDGCSDDHRDNGTDGCKPALQAKLEAALEFCDTKAEFPSKLILVITVHARCPDDGEASASVAVYTVPRTEPLKKWFQEFKSGRYATEATEVEFQCRYGRLQDEQYLEFDSVANISVSIRKNTTAFNVEMEGKVIREGLRIKPDAE